MAITDASNPDLIAFWDFEDVTGATLIDKSGNGHDGTIVNAPIITGIAGDAIDFSGNSTAAVPATDYVTITPFTIGSQFTLSQFYKPDAVKPRLCFFGSNPTTGVNHNIQIQADTNILRVSSAGVTSDITHTYPQDDLWHHIVVEVNSGTVTLYIDDVLIGSNTIGAINFRIDYLGVYSPNLASSLHSRHPMDQMRLFNRPLTPAERTELYQEGFPPVVLPSVTAKSVAIDIADNWGHSYMGANRFEFYLRGTLHSLLPADYTATATTTSSGSFIPEFAFDTSKSKTGDFNAEANHWLATSAINQRLLIAFNTPLEFDSIVFNGVYHTGALRTPATPQNTVITVSGQEVLSTVYDNPVGNGSVIFNGVLPQRAEVNLAQDYDVPLIDMDLVIQNPFILQEKFEIHARGVTTDLVTYDNPTTAGNILVSCFGLDKDSGAITVPPGWTRITTDETIYTVSGAMAFKVADGTETDVVWTWTTSQNSNDIWIAEIANATRIDVSAEATSSNVNTNDQSTGTTTPNTVQPALAVGMWAVDSARSVIEGVQSVSQGFGFLHEIIDGPASGHVGLAIATKELFDLAAVESTWSTTDPGTGDAMFGKVAVFTGDAPAVVIPDVPANLLAFATGDPVDDIFVQWDEVATADQYNLEYSTDNAVTWEWFWTGVALSKVIQDVSAGTYNIRVNAENAAGVSLWAPHETVVITYVPSSTQLVTDSGTQTQTISEPALTQTGSLATDSGTQTQTISEPALTQAGSLATDSGTQTQTISEPELTQAGTLATDSIAQAQTISEPELTRPGTLITDNGTQTQIISEPALTQAGSLITDNGTQTQTISEPALTQAGSLATVSIAQAQTINEPALTQTADLVTDNSTQDQRLEPGNITGQYTVNAEDLNQIMGITIPWLLKDAFTPDDLLQAQLVSLITGESVVSYISGELVIIPALTATIMINK